MGAGRVLAVALSILVGMFGGSFLSLYLVDPVYTMQVAIPQLKTQLNEYRAAVFGEPEFVDPYSSPTDRVFSPKVVKQYNGRDNPKLWLVYLGKVYDVTSGEKHYGVNGNYNFFTGRDSTRGYITGDFSDEGCIPSIEGLDLTPEDIGKLKHWRDFFMNHETYKYLGKLKGFYYDKKGNPTEAYKKVIKLIG
jgi:cytochrome b involved in lipid metabolism